MLRALKDIFGDIRYFWWNDFDGRVEDGSFWDEWQEVENPRRRYDPHNPIF